MPARWLGSGSAVQRGLPADTGRFYPEAWENFRAGISQDDRDGDLVAAYFHLLNEQPDDELRHRAAIDWCAWEDASSPLPSGTTNPRYEDSDFRMTFARIVTHYFHNRAWLTPDQLLRDADRLTGVPGALIHGRYDLGTPVESAWQLAQVWPDANLTVVENGHTGGEEMTAAILEAGRRTWFAVAHPHYDVLIRTVVLIAGY